MLLLTFNLVCRAIIFLVFLTAGAAKLFNRRGTRQAVEGFGVPSSVSTVASAALPIAELVVALALLHPATVNLGALAGLAMLVIFTGAIAWNLIRDRRPSCQCFGQLSAAPISMETVVRNLVLLGIAGVVVSANGRDAGPGLANWFMDLAWDARLLWVAGGSIILILCGLIAILVQLALQNGRLLIRVEALEESLGAIRAGGAPLDIAPDSRVTGVGASAPDFDLSDLREERVTLSSLRAAGKPVLLLFSDPGCGPCSELMPAVSRWQHEHYHELVLAVVSSGSREANLEKSAAHGLINVVLQSEREVSSLYGVYGTPGAVLVDSNGRIASEVAMGAVAIVQLVSRAVGGSISAREVPATPPRPSPPSAPDAGLPLGVAAPEWELEDLSGVKHRLSDYRGRRVLLFFFNPACGFCSQMLPELSTVPGGGLSGQLLPVMIGAGDPAELVKVLREHQLQFPVLHQAGGEIASAYQAHGTPMGYVIDPDGRIASELLLGAPPLLATMGVSRIESPSEMQAQAHPGLVPGQPAPEFRLPQLDGEPLSLSQFRRRTVLLVFSNPGCGFCDQIAPRLEDVSKDRPDVQVLVVSRGDQASNEAFADRHGLSVPLVLQNGNEVSSAYDAHPTPSGYLIDAGGTIATGLALGADALLALMSSATMDAPHPSGPRCKCGKPQGECNAPHSQTQANGGARVPHTHSLKKVEGASWQTGSTGKSRHSRVAASVTAPLFRHGMSSRAWTACVSGWSATRHAAGCCR